MCPLLLAKLHYRVKYELCVFLQFSVTLIRLLLPVSHIQLQQCLTVSLSKDSSTLISCQFFTSSLALSKPNSIQKPHVLTASLSLSGWRSPPTRRSTVCSPTTTTLWRWRRWKATRTTRCTKLAASAGQRSTHNNNNNHTESEPELLLEAESNTQAPLPKQTFLVTLTFFILLSDHWSFVLWTRVVTDQTIDLLIICLCSDESGWWIRRAETCRRLSIGSPSGDIDYGSRERTERWSPEENMDQILWLLLLLQINAKALTAPDTEQDNQLFVTCCSVMGVCLHGDAGRRLRPNLFSKNFTVLFFHSELRRRASATVNWLQTSRDMDPSDGSGLWPGRVCQLWTGFNGLSLQVELTSLSPPPLQKIRETESWLASELHICRLNHLSLWHKLKEATLTLASVFVFNRPEQTHSFSQYGVTGCS